MALNLGQRLDFCLGVDFILRQHDGRRAEALDDGAYVRSDRRARHQDGGLTIIRHTLKDLR